MATKTFCLHTIIKAILLILLGLFFVLNGINHLINTHIYQEYSLKKGLLSPLLMVPLSSVVLILGGLSLMFNLGKLYGIIGLCILLLIVSFPVHRFWREQKTEMKLLEGMHLAKIWRY